MTGTDRGAERRRLLEAVRSEEELDAHADDSEAADASESRPEPTPDGGSVTLSGPLYHCTTCDRTYLEAPSTCSNCGESSFERRTAE